MQRVECRGYNTEGTVQTRRHLVYLDPKQRGPPLGVNRPAHQRIDRPGGRRPRAPHNTAETARAARRVKSRVKRRVKRRVNRRVR